MPKFMDLNILLIKMASAEIRKLASSDFYTIRYLLDISFTSSSEYFQNRHRP